jgi:hypothetical protein
MMFKVLLECGTEDSVGEVSEPSPCSYEATLKTPLACDGQLTGLFLLLQEK